MVWSFYRRRGLRDRGHRCQRQYDRRRRHLGAAGPDGLSLRVTAGASPWIHGAIDPELDMAYYAFGNVRSCRSSQDGKIARARTCSPTARRAGREDRRLQMALTSRSAMTSGTWTTPMHPLLANVHDRRPDAQGDLLRQQVGPSLRARPHQWQAGPARSTKCRMTMDSRQKQPPEAAVPVPGPARTASYWQALDPNNIPGDPWRAVPNYNGYQPDASGPARLHRAELSRSGQALPDHPAEYGATHRKGCMYDTHWDLPVLSTTSQNGGPDWSELLVQPQHGLDLHSVRRQPGRALARRGRQRPAGARAVPDRRHPRASTPQRTPSWNKSHRPRHGRTAKARSRPRAIWCSSACSTATSSRWTR